MQDSLGGRYIISSASTKEVVTNGIISVSQGQCAQMANNNAAVEIKKISQYSPVDFFLTSMPQDFCKHKTENGIGLLRQLILRYSIHFSIFAAYCVAATQSPAPD